MKYMVWRPRAHYHFLCFWYSKLSIWPSPSHVRHFPIDSMLLTLSRSDNSSDSERRGVSTPLRGHQKLKIRSHDRKLHFEEFCHLGNFLFSSDLLWPARTYGEQCLPLAWDWVIAPCYLGQRHPLENRHFLWQWNHLQRLPQASRK